MIPKCIKSNFFFKITTLFAGYSTLSFILCFLGLIVIYLTMGEVDRSDRFLRFQIVYFLSIGWPLIISSMASWVASVFLGIILILIKRSSIVSTKLFNVWLLFILISFSFYVFFIWERSLYGGNFFKIIKDYLNMLFA